MSSVIHQSVHIKLLRIVPLTSLSHGSCIRAVAVTMPDHLCGMPDHLCGMPDHLCGMPADVA